MLLASREDVSVLRKMVCGVVLRPKGPVLRRFVQRCVQSALLSVSLLVGVAGAQLLATPQAFADATFVMQRKVSGKVTDQMQIWVRGQQMRVGQLSGMSGYMLYDQSARTITQVDEQRKVYRVVDEQAIAQIQQTLDGLQTSVMAQLKGLPPEQQAKMKAALGQFTQQPKLQDDREKLTLRIVNQPRKVAGVPCEAVEQYAVREKVRELCVASAEQLGLLRQDIEVAQSFYHYVREFAQQLPGGQTLVNQMSLWDPLLEKVPLQVKRLQGGQISSVYEMAKIDTAPVDAKLFAVPEGYQRAAVLQ
jgi:hypothetical protein